MLIGPRTLTVLVAFSTSKRISPRRLPPRRTALAATKSQLLRAGERTLASVRGEVPSVNAAGMAYAPAFSHRPVPHS